MGCKKIAKHLMSFSFGAESATDSLLNDLGVKYSPFSVSNFTRYGEYWSALKHALTPDTRTDREAMISSATNPQRIVYGRTKVGGQVAYAESAGSKKENLHLIVVVAAHRIDSFEEIWLGDELAATVTAGVVTVADKFKNHAEFWLYDGTQTAACPHMVAASATNAVAPATVGLWTDHHILTGLAYIHVNLTYSEGKFPSGLPEVKAVLKGKRVYDPRTASSAWSDNPALCIMDYMLMTESRGGMGCTSDEINDDAVMTMADICDQQVYVDDSTTEARYSLNGIVALDSTPAKIIETMLTSCAGDAVYRGGKWLVRAGYSAAPVAHIDESWLNGGITFKTGPTKSERINVAKAKYTNSADHWADTESATYPIGNAPPNALYWGAAINASAEEYDTDNEYETGEWVTKGGIAYLARVDVDNGTSYAPPNDSYWYAPPSYSPDSEYSSGSLVQVGGLAYQSLTVVPVGNDYYLEDGEELSGDMTLPFTTSGTMAQRLCKIAVEKSRRGVSVSYPCNLKAFDLDVNDVVTVSNDRLGWDHRLMKVTAWQFSPSGGVSLSLHEHDPSVYVASDGDVTPVVVSTAGLYDPDAVDACTGLAVTETEVTEGNLKRGRVVFSWSCNDAMVTRWIVTIDGDEWVEVSATQYVFSSLALGSHVFGVIPINVSGVRGAEATLTYTVTVQSGVLLKAAASGNASTTSATVSSADAGAVYTAAEQTLVNEMKTDINQLVSDLNAAVSSLNDLKSKLRTAGFLDT